MMRPRLVLSRFPAALLAVFALTLVCASSAAAASITFDGRFLRVRASEAQAVSIKPEPLGAPTRLRAGVLGQLTFLAGCDPLFLVPPERHEVRCPLDSTSIREVRYRITLSSEGDSANVDVRSLRGVMYGRGDGDFLSGDRVFGGAGPDDVSGQRIYGGPGGDSLYGYVRSATAPPLGFGGPGNDEFDGGGWFYGGPGNDFLDDHESSSDMLVGGPGRDLVGLEPDGRRDVLRVRGGGKDTVDCSSFPLPDPEDVLFVDRSDRLSPGCEDATVLYTARPRYHYP